MLLAAFNANLEHEPMFFVVAKLLDAQLVSVYRTATEAYNATRAEAIEYSPIEPSFFQLMRKPVSYGPHMVHVDVMHQLTRREMRDLRLLELAKWSQPPKMQGAISSDTMLMSDVLPKMHDAMMALYDQYGTHERVDASYARLRDIEVEFRVLIERDEVDPDNLLGDIYDEMDGIINSFLPRGWVFGTSEGDGACLGIWDYTNEED